MTNDHDHVCQWCEQSYPNTTPQVEYVDADGIYYACECPSKDECPGCAEHGACEDCGAAPAGDERSMFLCTACADKTADSRNEAAYERSLSDYYGGSGPVTDHERMDAAYAAKARTR